MRGCCDASFCGSLQSYSMITWCPLSQQNGGFSIETYLSTIAVKSMQAMWIEFLYSYQSSTVPKCIYNALIKVAAYKTAGLNYSYAEHVSALCTLNFVMSVSIDNTSDLIFTRHHNCIRMSFPVTASLTGRIGELSEFVYRYIARAKSAEE